MTCAFYERSQCAESTSQANMDKFYDTNAPLITLNDTDLRAVCGRFHRNLDVYTFGHIWKSSARYVSL